MSTKQSHVIPVDVIDDLGTVVDEAHQAVGLSLAGRGLCAGSTANDLRHEDLAAYFSVLEEQCRSLHERAAFVLKQLNAIRGGSEQ